MEYVEFVRGNNAATAFEIPFGTDTCASVSALSDGTACNSATVYASCTYNNAIPASCGGTSSDFMAGPPDCTQVEIPDCVQYGCDLIAEVLPSCTSAIPAYVNACAAITALQDSCVSTAAGDAVGAADFDACAAVTALGTNTACVAVMMDCASGTTGSCPTGCTTTDLHGACSGTSTDLACTHAVGRTACNNPGTVTASCAYTAAISGSCGGTANNGADCTALAATTDCTNEVGCVVLTPISLACCTSTGGVDYSGRGSTHASYSGACYGNAPNDYTDVASRAGALQVDDDGQSRTQVVLKGSRFIVRSYGDAFLICTSLS